MATIRLSFLLGGERFHGRLNRSSVLSDVPAKATLVNRAGPGYKVIRLRRLSHTRQLQISYPRPKSLDILKRVVAVLPRWKLASGLQQLRRQFFQFFQFFQSRRCHFFTSSPELDKGGRGSVDQPQGAGKRDSEQSREVSLRRHVVDPGYRKAHECVSL